MAKSVKEVQQAASDLVKTALDATPEPQAPMGVIAVIVCPDTGNVGLAFNMDPDAVMTLLANLAQRAKTAKKAVRN